MFTETDSLLYEIRTDNAHKDFYEDKNTFGFGGYPRDSNFFNLVNKKAIGKIKGEFKGEIIIEFGRLKSRMYSLVSVDGKEIKKAKRVNTNVMKSTIHKRIC